MKLEIKPEIEEGLLTQAHARGLSLDAYLDEVLEHAAHGPGGAPAGREEEPNLPAQSSDRPIWEVIAAIMKDVPDEVFDRLPKDGASQVDHYIYGLPKRD
jgi:mono/diheme cytochrome c family protein